ncbi:MAG: MBL fold metallo-hydrolase, partial [Bdellovibrionia bacterium]
EWYMVSATDEYREELRDILCSVIVTWGVPREVIGIMREKIVKALRLGGGIPLKQLIPYPKGPYKVGGVTFEAIHTPGHTEGLICLWWPERGILFSNDEVLEDITPNPTIYLKPRNERRCGLADYLDGLKNIENLPVQFIMPGHGDVFSNLKGKIAEIRQLTFDRQERVLKNLRGPDQEPITIIELAQKVWGDMDPMNMFLGAREIHGYMEMLCDQGIVQSEIVGDTSFYTLSKKSFSTETGLNI